MEQILLSIRTIISQTPLKLKKFNLKKKKKNLRSSLLTWLDYVPPSKKRNYLRKRGSAITSLPLLSIGNPDSQSSGIPRWFETSFHSKGHACNTEARDKKSAGEGWKVNEWNLPGTKEWCSWLTFIFRLSLMLIHPSSILAGNAGVQNTEPCRATFPPPYPTPFSVSLFLNTGCIFPGHSRCQESRASNVKGAADICWKKAQRGRANCPSAPFIREGVKSARRHNEILRGEEELEKRAASFRYSCQSVVALSWVATVDLEWKDTEGEQWASTGGRKGELWTRIKHEECRSLVMRGGSVVVWRVFLVEDDSARFG